MSRLASLELHTARTMVILWMSMHPCELFSFFWIEVAVQTRFRTNPLMSAIVKASASFSGIWRSSIIIDDEPCVRRVCALPDYWEESFGPSSSRNGDRSFMFCNRQILVDEFGRMGLLLVPTVVTIGSTASFQTIIWEMQDHFYKTCAWFYGKGCRTIWYRRKEHNEDVTKKQWRKDSQRWEEIKVSQKEAYSVQKL